MWGNFTFYAISKLIQAAQVGFRSPWWLVDKMFGFHFSLCIATPINIRFKKSRLFLFFPFWPILVILEGDSILCSRPSMFHIFLNAGKQYINQSAWKIRAQFFLTIVFRSLSPHRGDLFHHFCQSPSFNIFLNAFVFDTFLIFGSYLFFFSIFLFTSASGFCWFFADDCSFSLLFLEIAWISCVYLLFCTWTCWWNIFCFF